VPASERLEDDLFRFGWRYVRRKGSDGSETFDRVPLTAYDLLHPQEGDFIVQNDAHTEDCFYLKHAFAYQLRDDPSAKVFCDHRIAWDVPGIRPHGPDIFVVFGLKKWNSRVGTFRVAKLKLRPKVIVEVVSKDTRKNDLVIKKDQYYRARVPYYVVVDVDEPDEEADEDEQGERVLRILGYRRGRARYEKMPLDEKGRLRLEALKVWIGAEAGRVACYDENGTRIADPLEQMKAREDAEKHAAAEAKARKRAEARVAALEAQLRELKNGRRPDGSSDPKGS
jgi:Uma2 family endonuclease